LWCIEAAQVKIPHLISNARNRMQTTVKFQRHALVYTADVIDFTLFEITEPFLPLPFSELNIIYMAALIVKLDKCVLKTLKETRRLYRQKKRSQVIYKTEKEFRFPVYTTYCKYGASAFG
jgi:hypothetical protein